MRASQIATMLLKQAGLAGDAARGVLAAGKGFLSSGKHISKVMAEHGVQSPLAHAAVRIAPYAVAAKGVQMGWESEPVQKLRYRYAMRQAQRGY